MIQPDPSNKIFQNAVSFVNQTSRHLFITGKAGTGKTTFLKYIKENGFKKMAIVAPTGVAAINAGGVTIHSFFQLPFGGFIPSLKYAFGTLTEGVNNPVTLLNNLKLHSAKLDLIRELELLIIDEVSIVRADLLDAMDTVLRHVRKQPHIAFGGVQMVFIGDLFQLPPVAKREEWDIIRKYYTSPFFFSALCVQEAPPMYLELKKIYRQKDDLFISILNNIRNNCCSSSDLEVLHKYYKPGFSPDKNDHFITLTSHNEKADAINQRELAKLPGKAFTFEATISGEFYEKSFPAEKMLTLKEGAQVMFIKNDKGDLRRYFNGKIGTVRSINEKINIQFPGEDDLDLEVEKWQNIKYKYDQEKDKLEEEEQGTFTQFPIRLAWAITIHKSQGLTFDRAIIDAGASFAAGQVYVSLSRLTSLEGLVLYSRIEPNCISTDERVIAFVKNEISEDLLDQTLEDEQRLYIRYSLLQIFDLQKVITITHDHLNSYAHRQIPEKESSVTWARTLTENVLALEKIAFSFRKQLEQLFESCENDGYRTLQKRVASAAGYFEGEIDKQLLTAILKKTDSMRKYKKIGSYMSALKSLRIAYERRKQKLRQAVHIANGLCETINLDSLLSIVEEQNNTVILSSETKIKKVKVKKGDSSRLTLQLFKGGRSITDIASERGLASSTIYAHLAEFITTGELDILDLLDDGKLSSILNEINEGPTLTATELKTRLGSQISYGDIKAAMNYAEFKQKVY